MSPFPKSCGCGREHDAAEEWAQLRLVGHSGGIDAEGWWCVEMRNCLCGSTRAIDCETPPARRADAEWGEVSNAHP